MEPTLHCAQPGIGCEANESDVLVAVELPGEPERGDILVFVTPQLAEEECGVAGPYIKRVMGFPGEWISQEDGVVLIHGVPLFDGDFVESERLGGRDFAPVEIPSGHYFMMGDNRQQSCDSRDWGTVPRESIVGRVAAIERPDEGRASVG